MLKKISLMMVVLLMAAGNVVQSQPVSSANKTPEALGSQPPPLPLGILPPGRGAGDYAPLIEFWRRGGSKIPAVDSSAQGAFPIFEFFGPPMNYAFWSDPQAAGQVLILQGQLLIKMGQTLVEQGQVMIEKQKASAPQPDQ